MAPIEVVDIQANHPDLKLLINLLDQYLYDLYPPEEVFLVDFEDPKIDDVVFVVAYLNGKPIGCGAIREIDEFETELKRFFVLGEYRNKGVAGYIYKSLESKARNKKYKKIKLETGNLQPEAIGFYKTHGFIEIDRFGEYVDCPSSICMEKTL